MDPEAAIKDYLDAILDADYERAGECLAALLGWLARGGAVPVLDRRALQSLVNHAIGYCNAEAERIADAEAAQ